MSVSNTSRFTIHKNAIEYLQATPHQIEKSGICSTKDYIFKYNGDLDFKQFFRIDTTKAEQIVKIYPNTDLLLQNIHWNNIYDNIKSVCQDIVMKIAETGNINKLSIINISPLEGAILGKVFEELGLKNIVFNFNRSLGINSTSKTLEAILYLFSYENSPYFKEKTTQIVTYIKTFQYNLQNENNYIIIDENNNSENYAHFAIDDYLKHQIGEKEPKNIYRIDKYPDDTFLIGKNIKQILIFDNDNNYGQAHFYYKEILNTMKVKKEIYRYFQSTNIGYYEDYLIEKNKEYKTYKKEIEQKAYNSYRIYENTDESPKQKVNKNIYLERKKEKQTPAKDYRIIPYLFIFPIILIAFLINNTNQTNDSGATSGGGGSTYYGGGFGGGGNNTTISTPSTESKSIIKSFGGGGFSKGTT